MVEKVDILSETETLSPQEFCEGWIFKVMDLIKGGYYQEAIEQLGGVEPIRRAGFKLGSPRVMMVDAAIEPQSVPMWANRIASWSFFRSSGKELEMSNLIPIEGVALPDALIREIALVHLEEWTHGLQQLRGQNLVDQDVDREIDIALFFRKQFVPMTDTFLSRYGRKEVLEVNVPRE